MTSRAVIRVGRESPAAGIRAIAVFVLLAGMGCGNAIYAARITQASEELARAEQLGAEARAPYE
ncbi:MAG: hypothetical protein RL685_832 [Pseudomonadota bacterium]|jgi:hypothetical protein